MNQLAQHLETLFDEMKKSNDTDHQDDLRTVHDAKLELAFEEGWQEMHNLIASIET
jgi:hypothetical protein